jgi:YD repeat-containing protein
MVIFDVLGIGDAGLSGHCCELRLRNLETIARGNRYAEPEPAYDQNPGFDPFDPAPPIPGSVVFWNGFDGMGRPSWTMDAAANTWAQSAYYDAAGVAFKTSIAFSVDRASSVPIAGMTPTAWTETFGYDGFGNLTSKSLNGGANSIPAVDATTNRLVSSPPYPANGNMMSGDGASYTYDESNRLSSATPSPGHTEYYGYGPDNKRNYKMSATGVEEWSFYGLNGEKLVNYTFSLVCASGPTSCTYQPVVGVGPVS